MTEDKGPYPHAACKEHSVIVYGRVDLRCSRCGAEGDAVCDPLGTFCAKCFIGVHDENDAKAADSAGSKQVTNG